MCGIKNYAYIEYKKKNLFNLFLLLCASLYLRLCLGIL